MVDAAFAVQGLGPQRVGGLAQAPPTVERGRQQPTGHCDKPRAGYPTTKSGDGEHAQWQRSESWTESCVM